MTRRTIEPTTRFHLFLYTRDHEYFDRRFGAGAPSESRIGLGRAYREIIHNYAERLRAIENERHNVTIGELPEEAYADFDLDLNLANLSPEDEEFEDA